MIGKSTLQNYIINLLLALLASFSFVYALTSSLRFKYQLFTILLWLIVFLGAFSLVFLNRLSMLLSASAVILSLGLAAGYTAFNHVFLKTISALYTGINEFAVWIADYVYGDQVLIEKYEHYLVLLLCFAIALPVYLFTLKKFNFYVILVGGCTLFVSQWIMEFFISYAAFYIFLGCIIVYYFKYIFIRKYSKESNEYVYPEQFTLWVLPIAAAVVLLSLTMPSSQKPLEWQWLDDKITRVVDYFNTNYNYQAFDFFSVSTAGFGDNNGKLGGKARLDKTLVLSVNSPRMTYLKGSTSDFYDGTRWTGTNNEKFLYQMTGRNQNFDLYESEIGIQLLSNRRTSLEDFLKKEDIEVTYENIRTRSIFIPSKADSFKLNSTMDYQILTDANGILSSDRTLGRNFKYSITSYSMNYNDENFKNLLRKSKKGFYNDIINEAKRVMSQRRFVSPDRFYIAPRISYNDIQTFQAYAGEVYSKYLQLPDTLPKKVKDLASEITSKYTVNYDKARAIEQYLSSNYPYTLNTKSTPKGRDFVDYFLFDLKQGYCTYYASAMAIMLRSVGIPARYVEGYILPPSPESETTYLVTNQQAHAWVEVYFEGFGWLPFEPTSPFVSSFYSDNSTTGVFTQEFLQDPDMSDYIDELENYGNPGIGGFEPESDAGKTLPSKEEIIFIAILAVITVLLSIISFNFIKSRMLFLKSVKLQPRESILAFYKHYVMLLSAQKLRIKPGETALQYSDRVDEYFLFGSPGFKAVTGIFVKARYSLEEISDEDRKLVFRFNKTLKEKSRANLGKFTFFAYRYLLGKF